MNNKHKNISYSNNKSNMQKNKNDFTFDEFVNLTFYNPLHTLLAISEMLKLADK